MKQHGAFGAFCRDEAHRFGVAALVLLAFGAVLPLYSLPVEPVGYAAALWLVTMLFWEAARYMRYSDSWQALQRAHRSAKETLAPLPKARSYMEAEYQILAAELDEGRSRSNTQTAQALTERMDVFTLWAHQIKTPIAAMRLLLQDEQHLDRAELERQLFFTEQYVELAMQFLRLEDGTTDLALQRLPLDAVVRQAIRKYKRVFIMKKLRLDFQPTGATVLSDEKWLCFVVEQLLSNAVKYTPEGSVTIRWAEERTLMIEDTGIGIRAEDLPRIGEKGFTGFNGHADKRSTGLGLYLCRTALRRMGHSLRIQSEEGHGTRVMIDFLGEDGVVIE